MLYCAQFPCSSFCKAIYSHLMKQLDYRLQCLLSLRSTKKSGDRLSGEGLAESTNNIEPSRVESNIRVLLHFENDLAPIEELGLKVTSRAGDIVSGYIEIDALVKVASHPNVISIEASRPLKPELDVSIVETGVAQIRAQLGTTKLPHRGSGVIIGVIDSAFDLTHPCFRSDQNHTRIIAAWDQTRDGQESGEAPKEFGYGVEYTQEDIDKEIAENNILVIANSPATDLPNPHGTHVAGIAGGNGSAPPANTYIGVAPEADLILVAYNSDGHLGDSAFALDAASYIVLRAKQLNRPVVINLSQGDNFGAHDGTSLLEQAIDNLLSESGVAFVKSAGNERAMNSHATGRVPLNGEYRLEFEAFALSGYGGAKELGAFVPDLEDSFDIWYAKDDRIAVALQMPDGTSTPAFEPDSRARLTLPNENEVFINSIINHPENGDNRINIVLSHGTRRRIESGRWKIILVGREITNGNFHAWIDITKADKDFTPSFTQGSGACTVSVPGTSKKIITVGAYVTKPVPFVNANKGELMPASGAGPTRDARLKPDLTAPGLQIMSAKLRVAPPAEHYQFLMGTSMAAPHVTGLIALLFEKNKGLTQDQIKTILQRTATTDSFTGLVPNNNWGHGKLNALAAYRALCQRSVSATNSKGAKLMSDVLPTDVESGQVVNLEFVQKDKDRADAGVALTLLVRNGQIERAEARGAGGEVFDCDVNITLRRKAASGEDECWCCPPGGKTCFRIVCGSPCPP
jgi:subtilisin family serine protease